MAFLLHHEQEPALTQGLILTPEEAARQTRLRLTGRPPRQLLPWKRRG